MDLTLRGHGQGSVQTSTQRRQNAFRTHASFDQFVAIIAQIQSNREWYRSSVTGASLSQKLVRTLLWELITEDTLLFQAAIFVAGTYSNTCGLPPARELGPALIVIRGASLRALREAAQYAASGTFKTAAVALLAGWERKFGDRDTYTAHMSVWKALPLPEHALEESFALTLLDTTLEAFREGLDEHAGLTYSVLAPGTVYQQAETDPIPIGFADLTSDWPESRSLLAIAARVMAFDIDHSDSVSTIRKLCIEAIVWSPSHTRSLISDHSYEASQDSLHLSALYHIRAACISLTALFLRIASNYHEVRWVADIEGTLFAYARDCHHLPTGVLEGTAFQDIALWSRFTICMAGRDPESDPLLRRLMANSNIASFEHLEQLFVTFVYPRSIFREKYWNLFYTVTSDDSS